MYTVSAYHQIELKPVIVTNTDTGTDFTIVEHAAGDVVTPFVLSDHHPSRPRKVSVLLHFSLQDLKHLCACVRVAYRYMI
jgi:hypothetical protein